MIQHSHIGKVTIAIGLLFSAVSQSIAQEPKPATGQQVDVVRVDTSLVQTSVSVFDKRGNFVDRLRPEDFEFRINGKPQPISFFSRITAGTAEELKLLSGSRSGTSSSTTQTSIDTEIRGRTIVFFVDDLHLSTSSVQRTRQTILNFVDTQMGPGDRVAIASASGQIGFLQQFTDNKAVLRAAVARLTHRPYTVIDNENVPMTEYSALRIDQGDRDALTYYTNQLLLANNFNSPGGNLGPPAGGPAGQRSAANQQRSSGMSREMAERQVKERALVLLKQAAAVTTNTLVGLESLMRSSAKLDGRKLLFLVSDGFYLNDRNTGFVNRLHEITDAAVRSGVVIYSLDARGLIATIDVASNRADPEGRLSRSNTGEVTASQDALNALAGDTSGRALFDSDRLSEAVDRALKETSNYYLISWRPSSEEQKSAAFNQIEVSLPTHPELIVRLPKGYLVNPVVSPVIAANSSPAQNQQAKPAPAENPVDGDLKRALSAATIETTVPTTVAATFVDTPDNGPIVTASVQAAVAALDYGSDGKQAAVDVAGVVLNDQGKAVASFRTRLTVGAIPTQLATQNTGVVYNYKAKVTPGIYQVRAAVRDEKSGRVGSDSEWIEIPDLSSRRLTLSSLLLRSLRKSDGVSSPTEPQFSVDNRFSHSSRLNFFLFIYNASKESSGSAGPSVAAQVEVFRVGQSVISTPVRKLSTEGMADLQRIPYGGQFPLETLPTGRYELCVTITDLLAKTSASQRVPFQID